MRNAFRRKRLANSDRRRSALLRRAAPAQVESLESRVLLAATFYQTPVDVDVSDQPFRHQDISQVGVADNGDFVVLWEDLHQVGVDENGDPLFQGDVAFRRFNADGTPKESEQQYVVRSAVDEANVAIAVAGPGGFVAAWEQFDPGSGTFDIWFARYNAAGALLVAPTRANVNTTGDQIDPSVVIADDGTFIIAWQDGTIEGGGSDPNGDIAVRRFFGNGTPINASEFYVADEQGLVEMEPALGINRATGDFVITWTQGETLGAPDVVNEDVHYQLRAANGSIVVENARANERTLANQDRSRVAMAETGEFVITWESQIAPDGNNEVVYRRFTALGAAFDTTDQVITADPSLEHGDPVVGISADATRFVIGYEIFDPDNPFFTSGVVFQVFDGTTNTRVSGPSAVGGGDPVLDVSIGMNRVGDFVLSYTELSTTVNDAIKATAVHRIRSAEAIVAPGPGGGPAVRVYDTETGQLTREFFAYQPGFFGGVTVATGDLNGDGFPEIITGPGEGAGPLVRVFDGSSGALISQFFAYDRDRHRWGIRVATADVDGDGTPEVVTSLGPGGPPVLRVFNGLTGQQLSGNIFAFGAAMTAGVYVAAGDLNGDGTDELIAAPDAGGGPAINIFNGQTGAQVGGPVFVYDPNVYRGGVVVTAGDLDGDLNSEIIVGPAGGGVGPLVKVFDGTAATLTEVAQFFAFGEGLQSGVSVGTGDTDGDGGIEIIVGAGPGAGPAFRTFEANGTPASGTIFAFGRNLRSGIRVAGRALDIPGEGSPLTIDRSTPPLADAGPALGQDDVATIVDAAQTRFSQAGLSAELLELLAGVQFFVTDLGGDLLGLSRSGNIYLDDDAAGYGWFVDYSPLLDEEFFGDGSTLTAIAGGSADGRVDLLTAVMHELGHVLGLEHGDGLMSETLSPGVRRLATAEDLDALFSEEDLLALS